MSHHALMVLLSSAPTHLICCFQPNLFNSIPLFLPHSATLSLLYPTLNSRSQKSFFLSSILPICDAYAQMQLITKKDLQTQNCLIYPSEIYQFIDLLC